MGEDIDPLTTESSSVIPITNRGIIVVMVGVVIVGAIAGFIFGGKSFGFGILFGGVLAFANYFLLERSTRAIFQPNAITSTGVPRNRVDPAIWDAIGRIGR